MIESLAARRSVIPPTGEEGREKSRSKKKREKACTPIPIRFPPGGNAGFYSVHAGNDFTFSVLYTDSELTCVKNVYSWGYGSEGNHALNNHLHLRTPRESSHVMGILGRCSKFDLQCRGSQVSVGCAPKPKLRSLEPSPDYVKVDLSITQGSNS